MKYCTDCKHKYTNSTCDKCSKMDKYEKGNATIELLERMNLWIKDHYGDDYRYDYKTVMAIADFIDYHINKLKEVDNE